MLPVALFKVLNPQIFLISQELEASNLGGAIEDEIKQRQVDKFENEDINFN